MYLESLSSLEKGRLQGFAVSNIQKQYNVPKGTFYRAVKSLIVSGVIIKQRRNSYVISDGFRDLCNQQKESGLVVSG